MQAARGDAGALDGGGRLGGTAAAMRGSQAPTRRMLVATGTPKQVVTVAAAVLAVLAGSGGAGYAIRGQDAPNPPAQAEERLGALEKWRAAVDAVGGRDQEDRAELVGAVKELRTSTVGLREAVLQLTERTAAGQRNLEGRVEALERRTGGRP